MNFPKTREHTMTNCPTEDVLLDYIAGRLDRTQTALFERHAGHCADCDALRTAQAAVWLSLDEWKPAPVSAGFNRELWRRIDAEAGKLSWVQEIAAAIRVNLWKGIAPLAVAMAVVVTAFVLDHSGTQPARINSAPAPIVLSVSDADQLERALDDIQLLHEADVASGAAKPPSGLM
jgi:anti-sigma factor RsiW